MDLCDLADSDLAVLGFNAHVRRVDSLGAVIADLPVGTPRSEVAALLSSVRQMLLQQGTQATQAALRDVCADYEARARADGREDEIAAVDSESARSGARRGHRTGERFPPIA